MSKAIYGHLGGTDTVLLAEVNRLRRRVRELEEQVTAYEQAAATEPGAGDAIVSLREHDLDAEQRERYLDVALRELGAPALT